MREAGDGRVNQVAEAIQQYLRSRPEAADSEQGIAEWWLPSYRIDATTEEVTKALLQLKAAGVVEVMTVGANQRIWRARSRGDGQ